MPDKQQVAVVTGGGSGIGRSICLKLAERGHHIVVADLDQTGAQETLELIQTSGANGQTLTLDISDHNAVKFALNNLSEQRGVDILINNAGVACIGNIEQTSEGDLDRLYNINIKGLYNCAKAVIPAMKKQGRGIIINMASVASSVGISDRFAYSMSKGSVLTMTYSIAKDYLADGIRCNCVSPARVHTPFVDNFLANNYPDNQQEMFDKLSKTQPIGRMGTPDEVAAAVNFLCSEEAAFITGTNLPVDGGFITLNN